MKFNFVIVAAKPGLSGGVRGRVATKAYSDTSSDNSNNGKLAM